jgi:hypothetical protein
MTHYHLNSKEPVGTNGFIYFIEHQFAFKVGFSRRPKCRLASIQTDNYLPLKLTGTFEASYDDEQKFHSIFKSYGLGNEWYPISARSLMLEYLRNIDVNLHRNPKFSVPVKIVPLPDPPKPTDAQKIDRLRRFVNLDSFLVEGSQWHKHSPEILELANFGNRPRAVSIIGFGVPKIAKGKRRGELDVMRYFGKVLALAGYRIRCLRVRKNGVQINQYTVFKP